MRFLCIRSCGNQWASPELHLGHNLQHTAIPDVCNIKFAILVLSKRAEAQPAIQKKASGKGVWWALLKCLDFPVQITEDVLALQARYCGAVIDKTSEHGFPFRMGNLGDW